MMVIVVDSDALIGLLNKDDAHNLTATKVLEELIKRKVKLVYPSTVIAETCALLQIRLKKPESAKEVINLLLADQLIIHGVDENLLKAAASLLKPGKESSHNTLFDAIVAVLAKQIKAAGVFSYDGFYKKQGLKLAEDLI